LCPHRRLLLAVCLAIIAKGSTGNTTIVSAQTTITGDSMVENVQSTLGVCTSIVEEVNDFRDAYLTPNDIRRLSEGEEIDDQTLVKGVKDKLATCVEIVDAVDKFRKNYMAIMEPEEDTGVFSEQINLNVGGKLFTTSLTTLRSISGTFFEKMFRKGANTTVSADGKYFIDRDPSTFGYVLDYLRSGDLLIKSEDKNLRMQVLDDAEYFQLPEELKNYLRWSSAEGIDLWFSEVDFINKQLKQVSREMGGLLFQTSKDGDSVSTFHSRCDSKGPTVVIVETKSGNVFGGYTYTSWASSGGYASSTKGFLFQLRPSMKRFDLKSSTQSYAIYRHSSYGPTFGHGFDLYLNNCRNVATCYVGSGAYTSSGYGLNDGERYFRIKDYAVVQAKSI